jgi:hypothetical protein
MAGLDPAISRLRQMRGSSPRMTKNGERENFPLDNIPSVYIVSICSVKEAVIAKPHLFI